MVLSLIRDLLLHFADRLTVVAIGISAEDGLHPYINDATSIWNNGQVVEDHLEVDIPPTTSSNLHVFVGSRYTRLLPRVRSFFWRTIRRMAPLIRNPTLTIVDRGLILPILANIHRLLPNLETLTIELLENDRIINSQSTVHLYYDVACNRLETIMARTTTEGEQIVQVSSNFTGHYGYEDALRLVLDSNHAFGGFTFIEYPRKGMVTPGYKFYPF